MHKIVAAVNSMVENAGLISNVIRSDSDELFFLYNKKFKWSIHENDKGDYFLHYYPGNQSLEQLALYPTEVWLEFREFITYKTTEIKTKEAIESFADLYKLLQSKLYDIDSILDQIIRTAA